MIKSIKFKVLSVLFSTLLIFSFLPIEIGNAATLSEITTPSSIEDLNTIKVKNLTTQSESTISKSQYSKDANGISPLTEGSSKGYIPKGLSTVKPPQPIVIGSDDRSQITNTTAFPYSAICYIEIVFPNNNAYIGTAWMYAKNVAMTAGHCVYSASDGGWAKSVTVYPGRNGGSTPFGSTYATTLSAPNGWTKDNSSDYDWGLLVLNNNIGDNTGYFGATWTSSSLAGNHVSVTGYPGEKNKTLWKMNGKITSSTANKVFYQMDTTGGQSGCPVYSKDGDNTRAVAIHTTGSNSSNSGTRITKALFDYMNTFR
jgi:glutamyl endopeptidase